MKRIQQAYLLQQQNNTATLPNINERGDLQYASLGLKETQKKKNLLPQIYSHSNSNRNESLTLKKRIVKNTQLISPKKTPQQMKKVYSEKKMPFNTVFNHKKISQLNRKIDNFKKHQNADASKSIRKDQRQSVSPPINQIKNKSKQNISNDLQNNYNTLTNIEKNNALAKINIKKRVNKERIESPLSQVNQSHSKNSVVMKIGKSEDILSNIHFSPDLKAKQRLIKNKSSYKVNINPSIGMENMKNILEEKIEKINNILQKNSPQQYNKKFYNSDKKFVNKKNNKIQFQTYYKQTNGYQGKIEQLRQKVAKNMDNYLYYRGMLIDLGIQTKHDAFKTIERRQNIQASEFQNLII